MQDRFQEELDQPNCCFCIAGQFPVILQAVDHCTQQRMSKAFWAMQRAVRLKQTGALILQRMLHRRLAAAWCTWLDMVEVRQAAHCACSSLSSPRVCMHPDQHRTCRVSGLPWRAAAYKPAAFKPAASKPMALGTSCFGDGAGGQESITAVSRTTIHHRLPRPTGRLQERRQQHSAAQGLQLKVVARLQSHSLALAWLSWRDHVQRMQACRLLLMRIRCRGLVQALNAWRAHSRQMGHARQLLARTLGGTLRAAFDIWR